MSTSNYNAKILKIYHHRGGKLDWLNYLYSMAASLIYCYDAYCGWCYAFSKVMQQLASDYPELSIEVFSGGMILPEKPVPLKVTADYIRQAYPKVEALSGIQFGADYLWHIENPDLSDWYPNSEKPAIALCIFKEIYPDKQVAFAADLQYALYWEGRDLTDDEAYRLLLEKYSLSEELFYSRLHDEAYKQQAYDEFENCRQLKVIGYPCVFVQNTEVSFTLIARGYTDYATLQERLQNVLNENNPG